MQFVTNDIILLLFQNETFGAPYICGILNGYFTTQTHQHQNLH